MLKSQKYNFGPWGGAGNAEINAGKLLFDGMRLKLVHFMGCSGGHLCFVCENCVLLLLKENGGNGEGKRKRKRV